MPLKKKKVGSYPNAMIIASLTAALFLIGFCGLLVMQSKKLISIIKQNIEVRVMLDKGLDSNQVTKVYKGIVARPFVLSIDGKPQVTFFSKDEAAKEFIADTKEDFSTLLGDNPLHDSYRVRLQEDYFEDTKLKQIKAELEKNDGVFEVVYQENLADQINKNLTKIYLILATFAVIMLVIIILLMNNTIRLALYSQRFLIRSMQLVGATNGFIQRPFLKNGAVQGLISGLIAAGLIVALQQLALHQIEGLHLLQEYDKLSFLLAGVIILGALIGIASTFQALARYLRMALDDLY
ncbi:cell division transport system permease protein [Runella defluvii]|uniref:Cell division protein FtsX n=1 Tax=Runella defluvii TaxID=370973 RepID=A0A7W6ERT6_9BACT|nr:permease-like cell division protein FtsX [Runella defluvii]MBB3840015.1 cell division transport system permease protein [Runella defluvii]